MDVTDRKLAEEAMADIGRRLIEAHEEERTWIGREFQDDINQRPALAVIELEQRGLQVRSRSSRTHWSRQAAPVRLREGRPGSYRTACILLSLTIWALRWQPTAFAKSFP